ncbi:MAG: response regulator [Anaerolineales bacterium]|nr:response regulator [Anaerolineales bacterium]
MAEILIIEDNPTDRELALHALTKNFLFGKVTTLDDGMSALEYLYDFISSEFPQFILLDLALPQIEGKVILGRLKRDRNTGSIPVIILTSSEKNDDIQDCYRLGANSNIVKPADYSRYSDALKAAGNYWISLKEIYL